MSEFPLPTNYLSIIRRKAKMNGYDPKMLNLASDGVHKAVITNGDRNIKFGRLGMADFELLRIMERQGKIPKGEAIKRRNSYLKRSGGIAGDWASDKFSPNNLARQILW